MATKLPEARINSLGYQAISIALATLAAQGLNALLYLAAARATSPVAFGRIVTSIAIGMISTLVLDFGVNALWVRELNSSRITKEWLATLIVRKNIVALILGTIIWALATLFGFNLSDSLLIYISVVAFQSSLVPLRAAKKGTRVALALLLERVFAAGTFTTLCFAGLNPSLALVPSLALGSFTSA